MRIIAKTESTPHIPISVSPRISERCATEITNCCCRWEQQQEGKAALSHHSFSGFKQVSSAAYENISDLLSR